MLQFNNVQKINNNEEIKGSKYESKALKEKREEIKEDVIKSYKSNYNMKEVAKEFGIHPKTVTRILKENNIDYKSRGYASQNVKENPFDGKSIEDKSYWIGFISGDGYIGRDKNLIQITSKDYEIIEHFKNFIGEGLSIDNKTINENVIYVARFSHKEAKDYLVARGVTTNKSLTLKLKVKLNWNIVRGLFDADGSFSQNRIKITTGSELLLKQLTKFFKENNLEVSISDKGKGNCWDIYILGGKSAIEFVYNRFYENNSNYFLTRKKEQIRRYIE